MKERGFSFTDRAEKGFLYERIIFSLREPLIMVGRANNRLFTPAHGELLCVMWGICASAAYGFGNSLASAGCLVVPASSLRLRAGRYFSRLIMTSFKQSGAFAVKLNVTASPDAPAGVV